MNKILLIVGLCLLGFGLIGQILLKWHMENKREKEYEDIKPPLD